MDIARSELTAEDIGVRIRAVRELTGLTVGQVSKASGVPRRDINSAEHGRRVLDSASMRALSGALGGPRPWAARAAAPAGGGRGGGRGGLGGRAPPKTQGGGPPSTTPRSAP